MSHHHRSFCTMWGPHKLSFFFLFFAPRWFTQLEEKLYILLKGNLLTRADVLLTWMHQKPPIQDDCWEWGIGWWKINAQSIRSAQQLARSDRVENVFRCTVAVHHHRVVAVVCVESDCERATDLIDIQSCGLIEGNVTSADKCVFVFVCKESVLCCSCGTFILTSRGPKAQPVCWIEMFITQKNICCFHRSILVCVDVKRNDRLISIRSE